MKKVVYIFAGILFSGWSFGQTLESALEKTGNERYEEATSDYLHLIKSNPTDVKNYYFLGNNYYLFEKADSAKYYWNKAFQTNAEDGLALVAKGKVDWLNGNQAAANASFDKALKDVKRKEKPEIYREIGSFLTFAPNRDLNKAISYLQEAVTLEPTNVDGHLLLGDALLEKTPEDGSPAIKEYNAAEQIHQSAKTIVRKAKLYQDARNYKLANEMYEQAKALEPNYAPTYKAQAELQVLFQKYDLAIQNWQKYLSLNDNNYARYQYATALFSAKKYCDALQEASALKAKNYTSLYIERLIAYSTYDCQIENNAIDTAKMKQGLQDIEAIIAKIKDNKKEISGYDYKYEGQYLSKLGRNDEAIKAYYKAAEDTNVTVEVMLDLAKTFNEQKKYDDAIKAYNTVIAIDSNKLKLTDYYQLAVLYFVNQDFVNSDRASQRMIELSPNYSFAYFWRARANVYLDMDTTNANKPKAWSAAPFYQTFLDKLDPSYKATYKDMEIEAYKYLSEYYSTPEHKDLAKVKEIWTQVVALEPTNEAYQKKLEQVNKM